MRLFNFVDRNLVGITLLFRMQCDPIPARSYKGSQTFKHEPTLLKILVKCNQFTWLGDQSGQRWKFVYVPPAFVTRHAIPSVVTSISEDRTNGTPGNSTAVLRHES